MAEQIVKLGKPLGPEMKKSFPYEWEEWEKSIKGWIATIGIGDALLYKLGDEYKCIYFVIIKTKLNMYVIYSVK